MSLVLLFVLLLPYRSKKVQFNQICSRPVFVDSFTWRDELIFLAAQISKFSPGKGRARASHEARAAAQVSNAYKILWYAPDGFSKGLSTHGASRMNHTAPNDACDFGATPPHSASMFIKLRVGACADLRFMLLLFQ